MKQLAERARAAIDEINSAQDDIDVKEEHKQLLEKIRRFCVMSPKSK